MVVIGIAGFVVLILISVYAFTSQPSFGTLPSGANMEPVNNSAHYKEGKFQNLKHTPELTGNFFTVMYKFFFRKSKRSKPSTPLPSVKTNLLTLDADANILVWFGHSSYFIQVDGKTILVDPVFSGNASPVSFTTKSFAGSDVYSVTDFPPIDYLIISHDHWDHLDYKTILSLKSGIKQIITGLGVGAHFLGWGFNKDQIIEKDWNETTTLGDGFIVNTAPARHFSGRGLRRNQSIWTSFVLKTPNFNIYLGGDSGYDDHFATIGNSFGPFDLAILECGQYNDYWKYIHMMPEQVVQAAIDLRAKRFIPVHWAKFSLGLHSWDEPILRLVAESKKRKVNIDHPLIGEAVGLGISKEWKEWWIGLK